MVVLAVLSSSENLNIYPGWIWLGPGIGKMKYPKRTNYSRLGFISRTENLITVFDVLQ